jgi:hypothetical protein
MILIKKLQIILYIFGYLYKLDKIKKNARHKH